MSAKLKELEDKLKELVGDNFPNSFEQAFYIGVDIGRELEKSGIENYVNNTIQEKKLAKDKREIEFKKIQRAESFLLKLVKEAVKEHVAEYGNWHVEKRNYHHSLTPGVFKESIVEKFNVQYIDADMDNYGGDFELSFIVTGELERIFDSYGVSNKFTVHLNNSSGEEEEYVYGGDDIDALYGCRTFGLHNKEWTEEKHDEFYEAITKPFLFLLMSS